MFLCQNYQNYLPKLTFSFFFFFLAFPNKPPSPPSLAQLRVLEDTSEKNYYHSLKQLMTNLNFVLLFITYGMYTIVLICKFTVANSCLVRWKMHCKLFIATHREFTSFAKFKNIILIHCFHLYSCRVLFLFFLMRYIIASIFLEIYLRSQCWCILCRINSAQSNDTDISSRWARKCRCIMYKFIQ